MGKLPGFIFYPGDWMKDPELRAVSSGARGLWIDMLSLMFEGARRGYLQFNNGKAVTAENLARMTGNSTDDVSHWLQELHTSGVYSSTDDGVIYSRRQVRDEAERSKGRQRVAEYRERNKSVTDAVTDLSVSETVTEPEFGVDFDLEQATSFVFLEVGLAGNEARMMVNDAVKSHIHNHKSSPKEAAEDIVYIWQQYEQAEIDFKRGVFKFFKEGIWKQPRSEWGRRSYTESERKEARSQQEANIGVWRPS